jgi:hypothetical protein
VYAEILVPTDNAGGSPRKIYFAADDVVDGWRLYHSVQTRSYKIARAVVDYQKTNDVAIEIIPIHINRGEIDQIYLEMDKSKADTLENTPSRPALLHALKIHLLQRHGMIDFEYPGYTSRQLSSLQPGVLSQGLRDRIQSEQEQRAKKKHHHLEYLFTT